MNCEFEIAELFLGDIPSGCHKSLGSVELRIGRIYRTGLKLYAALGFRKTMINPGDIEQFRDLLRRHKDWMRGHIYIPLQGHVGDQNLAHDLLAFRRETHVRYRKIWRLLDKLATADALADKPAERMLKVNQILDRQYRAEKSFLFPLFFAMEGRADIAPHRPIAAREDSQVHHSAVEAKTQFRPAA